MVETLLLHDHKSRQIGSVKFKSPDSFEATAYIPAPSKEKVMKLIAKLSSYLDLYAFRLENFSREKEPGIVYHYMKFVPSKLPETVEEIEFEDQVWILNGTIEHDPPVSSLFAYDEFGIKVDWMTGFCGEAAISFPSRDLAKEGKLLEEAKKIGLYFDDVYNFYPVNISLINGIWRIKGVVLTVHWIGEDEEKKYRDMAEKFGIDLEPSIKEFSEAIKEQEGLS